MYSIFVNFLNALTDGVSLMLYITKPFFLFTAGSDYLPGNYVSIIYNIIAPIGITLAFGYFALEMISLISRNGGIGNLSPDSFIMPFFKICLAIFVIYQLPNFFSMYLGGSNAFYNYIASDDVSGFVNVTSLGAEESGLGDASLNFIGMLVRTYFLGFPALISFLCQIIAAMILSVQLISIQAEILIRYSFLPLTVSQLAYGDTKSTAIRNLKKMLGLMFLMGCVFIYIKLLAFIVQSGMKTSLAEGFAALLPGGTSAADSIGLMLQHLFFIVFRTLILPFAAIGSVNQVKSIINDFMG